MTQSPFTFFEFREFFPNCTKSEIDTVLGHRVYMQNLHMIAHNIDCIRLNCGFPIRITSGFRGLSHNMAVNGSPSSQHMLMQAIDVQPYYLKDSLDKIIEQIKRPLQYPFPLGQVIIYPTFVHLALFNTNHLNLEISYSK